MPFVKLCIFLPNIQNTDSRKAIYAKESLESFEMWSLMRDKVGKLCTPQCSAQNSQSSSSALSQLALHRGHVPLMGQVPEPT